ncbi:MAG: hypothetical protein R6V07_13020 [Armatimonadota bacterium]
MENINAPRTFEFVSESTGGKPFIFIIRKFDGEGLIACEAVQEVAEEFGLKCIDPEEAAAGGAIDLLDKIQQFIKRAEVVVAEVSSPSPNVFYEVGYANGIDKPTILLIRKGQEMPPDLSGRCFIEYQHNRASLQNLKERLRQELRMLLNSEVSALRSMLLSAHPLPAYILASPLRHGVGTVRDPRLTYEATTSGDNIGVRGLLSAFGKLVWEPSDVELLAAAHSPPNLLEKDASFYLIGSGKSNPRTPEAMAALQQGSGLTWNIEKSKPDHVHDEPMLLYREEAQHRREYPAVAVADAADDPQLYPYAEDYGLLMRGPHPDYPDSRIMLVMAGAHSLGTGAACLAATKPELIRSISGRLEDLKCDLSDPGVGFWALVRGHLNRQDHTSDGAMDPPVLERVTIEDVGRLQ